MRSICAMALVTLVMPCFTAAQTKTRTSTSSQPASPAQPAASAPDDSESQGWTGYAQVQGSSSTLGAVATEAIDVGYDFTPHFGVSAGMPLFSVRTPFSIVANHDWRWTTLIGDPWVDIHYTHTRGGVHFLSVLTGTIPSSSNTRTFTTGRFNADWFNHLDHAYKRFTPFVNLGVSNGTTNRYFLPRPYSEARPYQTLGIISDFEGGGSYRFHRGYQVGVSAYALVPAGSQKVYSRLVSPDSTIAGDGNHNRSFDSALQTIGPSRIDRDNGFSGWVEVNTSRYASLQIGYTRSMHYALDTITVTLTFKATALFRTTQ